MEASLSRSAADRLRPMLLEHRAELAITGSLVVLCVALTFLSPYFLTAGNIKNLIDQSTVIGIVAAGELMVILTGGIDLSVGAIMAVSGVVLGTSSWTRGWPRSWPSRLGSRPPWPRARWWGPSMACWWARLGWRPSSSRWAAWPSAGA